MLKTIIYSKKAKFNPVACPDRVYNRVPFHRNTVKLSCTVTLPVWSVLVYI